MDVYFQFDHDGKLQSPIQPIKSYSGALPAQGNILLFDGPEAQALESAGLPPEVWRVHQVAFDVSNGTFSRATLTLERRDAKAKREVGGLGDAP